MSPIVTIPTGIQATRAQSPSATTGGASYVFVASATPAPVVGSSGDDNNQRRRVQISTRRR